MEKSSTRRQGASGMDGVIPTQSYRARVAPALPLQRIVFPLSTKARSLRHEQKLKNLPPFLTSSNSA